MLQDQVLGPELAQPRVLDQGRASGCQRPDRAREVPPNADARAQWIEKVTKWRSWPASSKALPTRARASICSVSLEGASPRELAPLPVFGYPGWADNAQAQFYDDLRYLRPRA